MGNSKSIFLNISLKPTSSKNIPYDSFLAGQSISGTVYFTLAEGVKEFPAKDAGLYIILSGSETNKIRFNKTEHYTVNGNKETKQVTDYKYLQKSLVQICLPLYHDNIILTGGRGYEFPFEIGIPKYLPSSISYEEIDVDRQIEYKLEANGKLGLVSKAIYNIKIIGTAPSRIPLPIFAEPEKEEKVLCKWTCGQRPYDF